MQNLNLLKNLNKYCNNEKLFSGNSTGCSDITLQNINDGTYIFITSKYPKSSEDKKKQKSVDYYDIQNILAIALKNKLIYKNFSIYLVVPDKSKVLEKVKMLINPVYITEHINEKNIMDIYDLNKYFLAFKEKIF